MLRRVYFRFRISLAQLNKPSKQRETDTRVLNDRL